MLIAPFVQHFQAVRDDLRFNLVVYVAVIIYSGALALYYLFWNSETRIQTRRAVRAGI